MTTVRNKYKMNELLNKFKEKITAGDSNEPKGNSISWPNPSPNNEYKIRFLPDASQENVYKKYYYHMFQTSDSKWKFTICPKTFNFEAYCPCCSVAYKLYKTGVEADKQEAGRFKRKEKFVSNIFVVNDPRDEDKDDAKKCSGKVMIYEFATKLEALIRSSIFDTEEGVGPAGFDPTENGINFIIRVTETKAGADGKKWPAYDTSAFARNTSSIADNDDGVDAIMAQTVDLDEYLEKQRAKEDDIIELLKDENVYDLIAEEYSKVKQKRAPQIKRQEPELKEATKVAYEKADTVDTEEAQPKITLEKSTTPSSSMSTLDEELLAELEGM